MRALKSYGVAFVLVLLMAIWLGTGILIQGGKGIEDGEQTVVSLIEEDGGPLTDLVEATGIAKAEHADEVDEASLTIAERNAANAGGEEQARIVRVQTFTVQPMSLEVDLRGYTSVKASVAAVAETSGIIEEMLVAEGQTVAKGDLVCSLDQGTKAGTLAQAQASFSQADARLTEVQRDFDTNRNLREKGLATVNSAETFAASLSGAQAGLEAAKAALENAQAELDKTEVRAGVSGIVQRPIAKVGNLMNFGSSCATIVQMDPMVFTGAIPQSRIDLARMGMTATITTINDKTAEGEVSYIGVIADQATRTFEVEIEFPNPKGKILGGLTATARVDMGNIPAHLLPQSVLTLDSNGTLGLQAVKDNVVIFHPVTILRDTREGVWIAGLPIKLDVIILGQEYVKPGQIVDARQAEQG
ncbi:MAG: efflux RND transporter periplasmic adaptor subunit [Alphaproteobacteria bacterium]